MLSCSAKAALLWLLAGSAGEVVGDVESLLMDDECTVDGADTSHCALSAAQLRGAKLSDSMVQARGLLVNVGTRGYLSSGPDLLLESSVASTEPSLITWMFEPVSDVVSKYKIVNEGRLKYLGASGNSVAFASSGSDAGSIWTLVPVVGKEDTYFIIDDGKQMYLNGGEGHNKVTFFREGPLSFTGKEPEGLMWKFEPSAMKAMASLMRMVVNRFLVNVGQQKLLSSGLDLLHKGSEQSLTTWMLTPVPGEVESYLIINMGKRMYLGVSADGSGDDVDWATASWKKGTNWKLIPVVGKEDTYYIINEEKKMYLDAGAGRNKISLFRKGPLTFAGSEPESLMWKLSKP